MGSAESKRAYKERLLKITQDIKASTPCHDCKMSYHPVVMDFDHRDAEDKVMNVSELVRRGNETRLREEIAKCDVVCANCHRIRTLHRSELEQMLRFDS